MTIGIGYDVGYATRERLRDDWAGVLPSAAVSALEAAIGVTGQPARALAQQLGAMVDVPWGAAITVHQTKVIPRWTQILERSLPNADKLGTDCSGALVSLIYNRGASFQKSGDRYREMRNIHGHMEAQAFAAIPQEIRSMK